jgi:hypothetical protein
MSDDKLRLEYTDTNFYICLGEAEIELTLEEAESLFVVLGRAMQDITSDQATVKQNESVLDT